MRALPLITAMFLLILPALAGEGFALHDPWPRLYRIQEAVSNKIATYKIDMNVKHLTDAYKLASMRAAKTNRYKFNADVEIMTTQLMLQVVEECYKAREPNFNVSDVPTAFVFPPRETGLPPMRTDPDSIQDPEARRLYKQAIAENNKKVQAYEKQVELRHLVDMGLDEAETFFLVTPLDGKSKERALSTFTNTFHTPYLKELLFRKLTKGK